MILTVGSDEGCARGAIECHRGARHNNRTVWIADELNHLDTSELSAQVYLAWRATRVTGRHLSITRLDR